MRSHRLLLLLSLTHVWRLLGLLHGKLLALRQALGGQHFDVLFLQETTLIVTLVLSLLCRLSEQSLAQSGQVGVAKALLEERVLLHQRSLLFLQELDLLLKHELLVQDGVVLRLLMALIGPRSDACEHVGVDARGRTATSGSRKSKGRLLTLKSAHVESSANVHGGDSIIESGVSLIARTRLPSRGTE